ncbi:MAG: molybdopterin molybdotransferase MoeA [Candidatus Riflebacteria bacterium]|nr:molybdopterin molybdotransferase MoeA [Candidatus Riflebacteria bacterium]
MKQRIESIEENLLSFEEAETLVFSEASKARLSTELCSLNDCTGRILASDLSSDLDQPAADNSAMDGYCFRRSDVPAMTKNGRITFPVSGRILAGHPVESVPKGTAAYIATGGIVPSEIDCIVKIEDISVSENGKEISTASVPPEGVYIRKRGQDIIKGATLLKRGTHITPFCCGTIASMGVTNVPVVKRPSVAVVTSGDEVVMPFETPEPWQVRNSNSITLSSQIKEAGGMAFDYGIIRDTCSSAEEIIENSLSNCDILVTCGGVSLGEKDPFIAAFNSLNVKKIVHGVAIKPGKPFFFGEYKSKLIFGLPGNQASCAVTFEIFARPFIKRMLACTEPDRRSFFVRHTETIKNHTGRSIFMRGKLQTDQSGEIYSELFTKQESHMLSSLVNADLLAYIPGNVKILDNETKVRVRLL